MSNVILRTYPALAEGDVEHVSFNIIVEDEEWVGLFDRIQVFRSTEGPSGPFEELTSENWTPPRLPSSGGDLPIVAIIGPLVNIVGTTLIVIVNNQTVSITFTGSDPLTYTQVAAQITSQSLGRLFSYVDASGEVVIEALYPGLQSVITIQPSDAAIILDLPTSAPNSTAHGLDPRPALKAGQGQYSFADPLGSRLYHYRTRFLNSVSGESSDYSISFSAGSDIGVGLTNTIIGYAELAEVNGQNMVGAMVQIFNEFSGSQVGGKLVAGSSIIKNTDENGRVEFTLIRGSRITVSVDGTTLVRTITVPTDPALSTFGLFDPAISDADIFRVATPDIITAERRTL